MNNVDKRPPSPTFHRPADSASAPDAAAVQAPNLDPTYPDRVKAFDFDAERHDRTTRPPTPGPAPAIPSNATKNGVNTRGTMPSGASKHPAAAKRERGTDASPKDVKTAPASNKGARKPVQTPENAPGTAPPGAGNGTPQNVAPPENNPRARTAAASQVEGLTDENGVLTFTLRIPALQAGEPDETYRISVTGGQRTGLSSVQPEQLAEHLTQAIRLVQTDEKTRGFSSISFEGKPSDTGFAKAVVNMGKKSFILGGDNTQRVSDSDKIFADELHTLLQSLQESLKNGAQGVGPTVLVEGTENPGPAVSLGAQAPHADDDDDSDKDDVIRDAGRQNGSVPQSLAEQAAPPNSPVLPRPQSPVTEEPKGKRPARFEKIGSRQLEDEDNLTEMVDNIDAVHDLLRDDGEPGPSRSKG